MYSPGDPCWCKCTVSVEGDSDLSGYPLLVLLDIFGVFYYAPSFNNVFDSYQLSYPPGDTIIEVLPSFEWPTGAGVASGLYWYAGIVDPEFTFLVSNGASFRFGWQN